MIARASSSSGSAWSNLPASLSVVASSWRALASCRVPSPPLARPRRRSSDCAQARLALFDQSQVAVDDADGLEQPGARGGLVGELGAQALAATLEDVARR